MRWPVFARALGIGSPMRAMTRLRHLHEDEYRLLYAEELAKKRS